MRDPQALAKAVQRPPRRRRALIASSFVIAAAATTCVLLPSHLRRYAGGLSLRRIAELQLADFGKASVRWRAEQPDAACPSSIDRLAEYAGGQSVRDVYGGTLELVCTPNGFVVIGLGEDGRLGTADDMWSIQ